MSSTIVRQRGGRATCHRRRPSVEVGNPASSASYPRIHHIIGAGVSATGIAAFAGHSTEILEYKVVALSSASSAIFVIPPKGVCDAPECGGRPAGSGGDDSFDGFDLAP